MSKFCITCGSAMEKNKAENKPLPWVVIPLIGWLKKVSMKRINVVKCIEWTVSLTETQKFGIIFIIWFDFSQLGKPKKKKTSC